MTDITLYVAGPKDAHDALVELWRQVVRPHSEKGGHGYIRWQTASERRRHGLRKYFHGPVLRTIAEQVWLTDPATGKRVRYAPLVWKELFRQLFIDPEFVERVNKKTGEIRVVEKRRSTEDMSDDEFMDFVLQVEAFAVIDLGVEFDAEETREGYQPREGAAPSAPSY